ncbi:MAG: 50S ribosomal protein L4 [Pseudomonadota bacterium]
MKINVVNDSGKAGTALELSDAVFGVRFNEALVHQAVVAYQANGRQGTRKQKTRSEVRGGGRKPYAQKGTGQARAGTIRSPLWRGGGKVFPSDTNENFTQKVNRKMHRAALRSILSELARQDRLLAVSDFAMTEPKTQALISKLGKLGAHDVLIVSDVVDRNLQLAARNLPNVEVCTVSAANPVNLIRHEKVIFTPAVAKRFEEMLA